MTCRILMVLGLTLALTNSSPAQGRPRPGSWGSESEVEKLRSQIKELTARLDKLESQEKTAKPEPRGFGAPPWAAKGPGGFGPPPWAGKGPAGPAKADKPTGGFGPPPWAAKGPGGFGPPPWAGKGPGGPAKADKPSGGFGPPPWAGKGPGGFGPPWARGLEKKPMPPIQAAPKKDDVKKPAPPTKTPPKADTVKKPFPPPVKTPPSKGSDLQKKIDSLISELEAMRKSLK